ncbi:MAG: ankyrin repeat domain-containing protein, partial [Planctomycetota bacterium]
MRSNELIQRYSLGLCSEEEVNELERRLRADETLQDEFLREAEIDAHLRQEAQLGTIGPAPQPPTDQQSTPIWKWVSGISTLTATVLLALMSLNFPPQQYAMAYPSLGQLTVKVPMAEQNIWAAAADGDFSTVNHELENRVSVDGKAECGLTPLHVAALFGQSEVAGLLLSSGADVSLTDGEGNTALHMAAFLGHTEIVRALLKAGTDPAIRNHLGFSSVDNVAVRWSSDLEAYYHHLEKVLDVSLDLERIQFERPKILKLLSAANLKPTQRAPTISLWQAAITGNTSAVEQHVAAGTNLDEKEDYGGSTPLILAAIFGQDEVARILIAAGAEFEVRNANGSTALHQAC